MEGVTFSNSRQVASFSGLYKTTTSDKLPENESSVGIAMTITELPRMLKSWFFFHREKCALEY